MKNSSSSSRAIRRSLGAVTTQNDRGFERVADQLLLPRLFDRLTDDAAQLEQFIDQPNDRRRRSCLAARGNSCR